MRDRTILMMVLTVIVTGWALGMPIATAEDQQEEGRGAVFVMTNSTDRVRGNEIVMYKRDRDGTLTFVGYFPTGRLDANEPQLGSGPAPTAQVFAEFLQIPGLLQSAAADALGSNNSLLLDREHRCLFAVNAGSNTVSSFRVRAGGLRLESVVSSQGDLTAGFPVSLTEFRNILYVLNSGAGGSLAGFRVRHNCVLDPLAGSSRDLSDVTNPFFAPPPVEVLTSPAQISFSPDGTRLVLSDKGGPDGRGPFPSGRMAVFSVESDGLLSAPVVTEFDLLAGRGSPFSFIFANAEVIVATTANSQTVASYTLHPDNTLSLLSGPFPTSGFAPCWLHDNGSFVFVAAIGPIALILGGPPAVDGSGTLDGFRINQDGTLTPLGVNFVLPDAGLGRSGNHAIDVRVVGSFLYFIQPRIGMVGWLKIDKDTGALVGPVNCSGPELSQCAGGLAPGVEPSVVLNPGINNFLERCFLQDPTALSPECLQGSAQGITGF